MPVKGNCSSGGLLDPFAQLFFIVTAMWGIDVTWIRLIDDQLGFGHKEEWTPPAARGK